MDKREAEALAKTATADGHPARAWHDGDGNYYLVVKRRVGDMFGYRVYDRADYLHKVASDFGRDFH